MTRMVSFRLKFLYILGAPIVLKRKQCISRGPCHCILRWLNNVSCLFLSFPLIIVEYCALINVDWLSVCIALRVVDDSFSLALE
jgi:hypothetical protein